MAAPVVSGVRGRRRAELVEVARQPTLSEAAAINLGGLAWWLLAAAARQPVLLTTAVLLVWSLRRLGPILTAGVVVAAMAAAGVWWWRGPTSYERLLACRLRACWR